MATKKGSSAKPRKGGKAPTKKPAKKHPGPVDVPDIKKYPKKKKHPGPVEVPDINKHPKKNGSKKQ